jgi:hypothetical protein
MTEQPLSPEELDLLIDTLADDDAFGDAKELLVEYGQAHYPQLLQGVQRALTRRAGDHSVTLELPWILKEATEDNDQLVQALKPFLQGIDTGLVAIAMDVIVETEDATLANLLAPFQDDERWVEMRGVRKDYHVGAYAKGALDRLLFQR